MKYESDPEMKKGGKDPGLKTLLKIAVARAWIRDEGFAFDHKELVPMEGGGMEYRPIPEELRERPTKIVLEVLPKIRNDMAHGLPHVTLNHVGLHLQRATEIINQLFPA